MFININKVNLIYYEAICYVRHKYLSFKIESGIKYKHYVIMHKLNILE